MGRASGCGVTLLLTQVTGFPKAKQDSAVRPNPASFGKQGSSARQMRGVGSAVEEFQHVREAAATR